ncbi:MAG: 50S ribosomal protein L25 [Dehalococcoidia bacterium]|nr:50S ribosomal protein L25 [Dehalococcoidia bacterium]
MDRVELTVAQRSVLGKKVKALRRSGITPANVYGHRIESQAVEVDTVTLAHTLKTLERNAILSLRIEGEKAVRPVIVREVRRDILNDKILHVDFYQVSLAEKMKADVPFILVGKAPAVEDLGGILLQGLDSIAVEALPADIPPHIEIDISSLTTFDSSVHVRDLVIDPKVHVLTEGDSVITSVAPPRKVAEAVVEEEAAAAEEEKEGAAVEESSE